MKQSKYDVRKIMFYLTVIIGFAAVLLYNCLTPLMSDELLFDASVYHSFADILKAEYDNYMGWNGRSVVQLLMRCFLMLPKWAFNLCNSACFVLLTLLMYWNIEGRKQYDFVLLALIHLMIWQFGVSFDQTVLWVSGACNYLWGATIILGFVTFYRCQFAKSSRCSVIGIFFFGMLAGWCNENTSGGGLLLVIYSLGRYLWNQKQAKQRLAVKPWMISGIAGMVCGLLFMVAAPGNRIRGELLRADEEHQGILALVGRFLKINAAVEQYLFPMLVVIILLLTYYILKKRPIRELVSCIAFAFVSIATSYALIMTPQPMDRAYFGAGIFMTIAFVQAVALIPERETALQAVKYGGVAAFTVFLFFVYCENGADLTRILREVNEREAYILEQKAQGNYDLTVPMLREEFQTKYSFLYMNDVDEDPDGWGCSLYRDYYELNSLTGIPRDEWTEY